MLGTACTVELLSALKMNVPFAAVASTVCSNNSKGGKDLEGIRLVF